MQAIIIATGEEEKLKPLTDTLPTPMVPLANQPVMTYAVEQLARYGVKKVHVNLHHLSGSIESYFGAGRRWGIEFEYLLQKDPLGNAGAIAWAKSQIDDTVIVFPGDQLIDLDIDEAVQSHKNSGASVSILVCADDKANSQKPLHITNNQFLSNAPTGQQGFSTGFFILNKSVLENIPLRQQISFETDLFPDWLNSGEKIHAIQLTKGYWNPLTTFQQYAEAQNLYLDSASGQAASSTQLRYPSMDAIRMGEQVWAGRHNMIHPTVRIVPPVTIGEYCQIGRDVELGPYTVIGSNVIIDDEASVIQSTVIANTYIGQLVNVDNRVISRNMMVDAETSQSLEIVDRFLIGEANPSLVDSDFRRFVDGTLAIILCILLLPIYIVIGLITLINTGRIMTRTEKMGILPRSLAVGGRREIASIKLLNFATERRNKETAWGRWLKKSDLHRLPELINVADGSIGMVGVKPLTQEEISSITEEWQNKRFEYMAGFTGLWYVENRKDSTLDEDIISDVYYVATRRWRKDLALMLRTPGKWWRNLTS